VRALKRPFDPWSKGTGFAVPLDTPTPVVAERSGSVVPQGTPMSCVVGRWAELCFSACELSSETELKELIQETEDDALDDNDEAAAVTSFPTSMSAVM
jgi:hypothetical protein